MKNAKITPCSIFLFCFFILVCLFPVVADASKNENGKWSFEFNNCTILDALKKISDKADIEIVTNYSDAKAQLNKSYHSKNIEKIIADLFRKENCAIIWQYDKEKLNGVKILVYESSKETIRNKKFASKTAPKSFPKPIKRINNPISDYRKPKVIPQRRSIAPRNQFSRKINTRNSAHNSDVNNKPVSGNSSASSSASPVSTTTYFKKNSNQETIIPVAVSPPSSNQNQPSGSLNNTNNTTQSYGISENQVPANKATDFSSVVNDVETIHVSEQKDNVEQEIPNNILANNDTGNQESELVKPIISSENSETPVEIVQDDKENAEQEIPAGISPDNDTGNQESELIKPTISPDNDGKNSEAESDNPTVPPKDTESASETSQNDQVEDDDDNDNDDDDDDQTPPTSPQHDMNSEHD